MDAHQRKEQIKDYLTSTIESGMRVPDEVK
jgi:hypothetical protein